MRTATISLSIVLAAGTLAAPKVTARNAILDYLDAPRTTRSPYDSEVKDHFFVTAFDCGRYFEDTNFSVSVYLAKSGDKAVVSSVASSQDLLDVPAARHGAIRYTRRDREISKATALLLRSVWRQMLERRFLSQHEKDSLPVAVLDDFTGQFSLQPANGRILRGDLPIGSKFWGYHIRGFWDLANLLYKFSAADNPGSRDSIEKEMKKKAEGLLSTLQTKPARGVGSGSVLAF